MNSGGGWVDLDRDSGGGWVDLDRGLDGRWIINGDEEGGGFGWWPGESI